MALAEAEILPLEKKSGGLRPIMMVNSLRKVTAANLLVAVNLRRKQF